MATSNLVAFDAHGRITKYANVEEILKAFYEVRIKFYEKRKAYQLNEWGKDLDKLSNQARFVKEIIDGKLVVAKKKKADLVVELKHKNYTPYPKVADATKDGEVEPSMEDESGDKEVDTAANAYDYLLGVSFDLCSACLAIALLTYYIDGHLVLDQRARRQASQANCRQAE
jgi:DNA topoisomerase-2